MARRPVVRFLRVGVIHIFIVLSFIPTVYYNVLGPLTDDRGISIYNWRDDRPDLSRRTFFPHYRDLATDYWRLTRPVIEFARIIGCGTVWRMFSPSWKHTYWIDWYGLTPQDEWVPLPTRNLSPRDRQHRGWLHTLLWDFKLARLQSSVLQNRTVRRAYGLALCRTAQDRLGWRPIRVRAMVTQLDIPRPRNRPPGWSPLTAPIEHRPPFPEIPCL